MGGLDMLRRIVVLGLVIGLTVGTAWAEDDDIPDVPRTQDLQIVETCLKGIDARGGQSSETCFGQLERGCEEQFGSNTIELSRCRKLEAATWAVLPDHELGYNVEKAKFVDAQCARPEWKSLCYLEPDGKSDVEESLRTSQAAWVTVLSTTCDFKYKMVQQFSAIGPDFTDCLRRLVFERHQRFWRYDSAGCECNVNLKLQDMQFDGEVVPFAFR